jgi:hypothetical protein
MSAVKLLIAAESNSGKTTLTKSLENALVVSYDGKKFPFRVPHVNVEGFDTVEDLINLIGEKVEAYNEKFGHYPSTIVFDSVSKIFDTVMDNCNTKYKGFQIYTELNKEVHALTDYIQNVLIASDINVILISHAIYDPETSRYNLIGKGDFQKRGGFVAETDEAIFIEVKNNKRIVHFRSTKFPARTLQEDLPDSIAVEEFNLGQHIALLEGNQQDADEFAL